MDDMGNFDIPVLREKMLAKLGGKADAYPHRIEQRFQFSGGYVGCHTRIVSQDSA